MCLGGCNCALVCLPCNLPRSNLSLAWVFGANSGTATLTFLGTTLGVSQWATACVNAGGGNSFLFGITCNSTGVDYSGGPGQFGGFAGPKASETQYQIGRYAGASCGGALFAGYQYGTTTGVAGLVLTSSNCSPRSIVLTPVFPGLFTVS